MSILETARKMAETAVTQKGLIKQIDLITVQTTEMRKTRAGLTKEEQVALDKKLKQLHKRKVELEAQLEDNDIEAKEAAAVEVAASYAAEVTKELKELEKLVGNKFPAKVWSDAKKAKDQGLPVTDAATAVLLMNGFDQYGKAIGGSKSKGKKLTAKQQKDFDYYMQIGEAQGRTVDTEALIAAIKAGGHIDFYAVSSKGEKASVEETAAPLSKEKYDWYKYVGARGTKITNSRGNRTVTLKNGSMFGVRPATSKSGKVRIISEELGPTIVFSFDQDAAVKIIQKGVRIPVKVTFKRPEAPAAIKKVVKAAKTAAGVKRGGGGGGVADEHLIEEAIATYNDIVAQLDGSKLSKETVVYFKWASKQAAKIAKKVVNPGTPVALLDSLIHKKVPKLKTKKVDAGNGNVKTAEAMGKFIPSIAKRWKKNLANEYSAPEAWETLSVMLSDLADYTKLYVALCGGNAKAINSASYFDTNIREELPKAVWNWLGKQGRMGY